MPIQATTASETAQRYYDAMVHGDGDALRELFDARVGIVGHFEGAFLWQSLDDFIDETKGLVGQHGAETCTIETIRIDGSIAAVTIAGRYAGLWIVDHLLMVDVDGALKIVAKTFHVDT